MDSGALKLLIVDDEPKSGQALERYFSIKGFEVRAVMSGEEALALAPMFQPHVVLLDLLMPGKNGVDTLKEFKAAYPAIRVIMLSGADLDDVVQGALKLGADSYVCKPPDLVQLERLINGYWPSRKSAL